MDLGYYKALTRVWVTYLTGRVGFAKIALPAYPQQAENSSLVKARSAEQRVTRRGRRMTQPVLIKIYAIQRE